MTDTPTYIVVPGKAPVAYWDNWAEEVSRYCPCDDSPRILRTIRTGRDGVSDATYIHDRLASGLYWSKVTETVTDAADVAAVVADDRKHEGHR